MNDPDINDCRKISVEELRKFEEFRTISDNEAVIIINDIYLLSLMLYELNNL
jgi:hypothetical protein